MSNEPKAGPGVDPEMLAAYIDKTLSPEQRAAVEARLDADPDSYAVLVESLKTIDALESSAPKLAEFGASEGGRKGKVLPFGRWVIAAGSLAAAAALAMAIVQPELWRWLRGDGVDSSLERLVEAVGNERYIEARLSGGFRGGPFRPVNRNSPELSSQNLALLSAAAELQRSAGARTDSAHLHAWGVAQVLLGDLDSGIETLQSVIQAQDSPAARSDLSAALLTRAQRGRPSDLPAALEHADAALSVSADFPEALFNRALALENLRLRDEAIAAWRRFLEVSQDRQWTEIARQKLQALESKALGVDPSSFDGVPWSRDRDLSLPGAMAALRRSLISTGSVPRCNANSDPSLVQTLVDDYTRASGDRLLADALHIEASAELCSAVASLVAGVRAFEADDLTGARRALARAQAALPPSHPLAVEAAYYTASLDNLDRRFELAEASLDAVARAATIGSYLTTAARAEWTAGVTRMAQSNYPDALPHLHRGADLAAAGLDPLVEGRIRNQIADALEYLGDSEAAWQSRVRALDLAELIPNWRLRNSVAASLSTIAARRQLSLAALSLQRAEAATVIERRGSPLYLISLLGQVDTSLALGRLDNAESLLASASGALSALRADPRYPTFFARVALKSAVVALSSNRLQDGRSFLSKIDAASLEGRESQKIEYLSLMSATASREGDAAAAATYAKSAIKVLEDRRTETRQFVFGAPDIAAIRATVELALESGLADEPALQLVLTESQLVSPASNRESALVPTPGTATIVFRVMSTQTVAWLMDSSGVKERRFPLSRTDAMQLALRLKDAVASGDETCCWEGAYDRLFGEWGPFLATYSQLRLVPDWPLDSVPFAALRSTATRRHLVEDVPLVMGMPMGGPARTRERLRSIVAVAAEKPAAGFAEIPTARLEAEGVASFYRDRRMMSGSAATIARFKHSLDADVVHIAAHAVVDRVDGRRSRIVLSDGAVFGEDLQQFDFSKTKIVVLAACSTGRPDNRPSSPFTLASQVLAAGADYVLATTADIDDDLAEEFFLELHKRLSQGGHPAEALRATQRSFMHAPSDQSARDRFKLWGSIVILGR